MATELLRSVLISQEEKNPSHQALKEILRFLLRGKLSLIK